MPVVLEPPIVGLAGGYPDRVAPGTGKARPGGIEYLIEYGGIVFNNTNVLDKIRITEISGLDDADIRDAREANPSYHGETAFDAWYGGRTITLTGRIEAYSLEKMRDMQMALRQAFSVLREQPLIFRSRDGKRDTFLMVRKSAPLAMRESQGDFRFFRDFLVTLRASNPRFLDHSRQTLVTQLGSKTNLILNPSFETDANGWESSPSDNLTNLIPNPSFEVDTAGWTSAQSILSSSTTVGGRSGSRSLLIDPSASGATVSVNSPFMPVVAGQTYAGAFEINPSNARTIGLQINWYRADNSWISTSSVQFFSPASANVWTRISGSATAPAEATQARVEVNIQNAGDLDKIYVDSVLFKSGSTVYTYFDGDTEGFEWNGVAHNSTTSAATRLNRDAGWSTSGTNSLNLTIIKHTSGDLAFLYEGSSPFDEHPVSPGGSIAWAVEMNVLETFGEGIQLALSFYASDGITLISRVYETGSAIGVTGLGETRRSMIAEVPPGAAFVRPEIVANPGGAIPGAALDWDRTNIYIDSAILSVGDAVPSYFDGDDLDASWTGVAHASTSVQGGTVALDAVNHGNFRSQPIIRIAGGVTDPVLTNLFTGETLRINGTINEGEYLDIDIGGRKIEDNTGANRFGMLDMTSDWMELEPSENRIEISSASVSGTPSVTIFFRNTWM